MLFGTNDGHSSCTVWQSDLLYVFKLRFIISFVCQNFVISFKIPQVIFENARPWEIKQIAVHILKAHSSYFSLLKAA